MRSHICNGVMLMLFAAFFVPQARAANICYSPAELRAEQLLRLHSELMVITVTCHQGSKGENLVPYYTGFTQAHIAMLHDAEQIMEKHYRICFGGDGINNLDKLRTRLGNEYGQKIADVSAPSFCSQFRDHVIAMYNATPLQINAEISYLMATERPYEKLCAPPAISAAKKAQ